MVFFNSFGLVGAVAGIALVWLLEAVVGPMLHLPEDWGLVFNLQAAALLVSLFGLTFDRCEERTLVEGYTLNVKNFFIEMSRRPDNGKGVFYRPDRVLCFCGMPLAMAPLFVQLGVICFWIYAAASHDPAAQSKEYPLFTLIGFLIIGLCLGYAALTRKLRNLSDAEFILQHEPEKNG